MIRVFHLPNYQLAVPNYAKSMPRYAFQNVDVRSTFRLLKDLVSSVNVWRILKDMVDVNLRQRHVNVLFLKIRPQMG